MGQRTYDQALRPRDDGFNSARGITVAILVSLPLWAVIIAVGYWWLGV